MKQKLVILRSTRRRPSDVLRGGRSFPGMAGTAAAAELEIEVDEVKRSEIPKITRDSDVIAVAPAMPMKLIAPVAEEDAAAPAAGGSTWGVAAVGADTSPFTGDGIVVAVLDTGIHKSHPAFSGMTIVERDFTGAGNGDTHGHGTHCAGTIFGRDVDGLRIGVARGVKKALIGKVLAPGAGTSDQVVSAIQWAIENGANVISMSLGIDFPGFQAELEADGFPPELAATRALEGYRLNVMLFERLAGLVEAMEAFRQPAIIIAAAGNESRRDEDPKFEISVSPPAVSDGIISVAALGQGAGGFVAADFSNTGANISGPGVGVISAKRGSGLVSMNGTSMATPHVAGVAAVWAEKLKDAGRLSSISLTTRLLGSGATDVLAASFDPFDVGEGMVQAPQV